LKQREDALAAVSTPPEESVYLSEVPPAVPDAPVFRKIAPLEDVKEEEESAVPVVAPGELDYPK